MHSAFDGGIAPEQGIDVDGKTSRVGTTMNTESEWHEELTLILDALNDAPLECDGMTYAISVVLTQAGIRHRCLLGYVRDKQTGNNCAPHWIQLADGWIVDFRLRMWLGDEDRIPHGVFHPSSWPDLNYEGSYRERMDTINPLVLEVMTEGKLSHVKVPRGFAEENPDV
ncbi:hypothetical protein [Marinobacterium aestuariivivens]|uniref:Transglutaminase-like domain-containing protein n=1 Tax=Marinobacterium aestuariivivens TaxID=1698799 RepID=A0ABW2A9Y2_9GAMM